MLSFSCTPFSRRAFLSFLICLHAATYPLVAQQRVKTYDISSSTATGDKTRGPKAIRATGINPVRYDYRWNTQTTFGTAPDLWTGLTAINLSAPAAPAAVKPAVAAGSTAPRSITPPAQGVAPNAVASDKLYAKNVQPLLDAAAKTLADYAKLDAQVQQDATDFSKTVTATQQLTTQLNIFQANANNAIALVNASKVDLTNFLSSTDPANLMNQTDAELAEAARLDLTGHPQTADSTFVTGVKASWPDITSINNLRQQLAQNGLDLMDASAKMSTYMNKTMADLKAKEAGLTDAKSKLDTVFAAYVASKKDLSAADEQKEGETATALDAAVKELQADETHLTALQAQFSPAIAKNTAALSSVGDLAPTSATYVAFTTDHGILLKWKIRMSSVLDRWRIHVADTSKPNPLETTSNVASCGFAFSTTKDNTVTLNATDQMPGGVTAPQTLLSVTVECTSPFSISAGVVFSTIPDHVYTVDATPSSPGSTTTVQTFVEKSTSNFHPLPVALINTRLHEFNEKVGLYGSFGVAANIRSPTSGGSAAEYLLGISLGLFRTAFVTAGMHLGNENRIGDGYAVGGPAPTGVTTVPVQTSYRPGFGLAITFTKP